MKSFLSVSRFAWIVVVLPGTASAQEVARLRPNSADEPFAKEWSRQKAGEFLDRAAEHWLHARGCASCHSTYSYLMARPTLGDPKAATLLKVRKHLEDRVANWDSGKEEDALLPGSEGPAEVVAVAATLAFHDAHSTAKLHPRTRQALERMWKIQRADGIWDWNKHDLPPQEHDDYFGALFAALGVGHAPEGYAREKAIRPGVERLRAFFRKNPPADLHHRAWLLWASLKLDGLMTNEQRQQAIKQLRGLQRPDGGWNLPSLGHWRRHDGTPNNKQAPSDGYATGLVVTILRKAGVKGDDEAIRKAVQWLKTHQRDSGRWFTRSLSADRAHYISHAGSAYAVIALCAAE
jgi:squalene-hopene/tetraprenyl-beta-curcumene cyclase